MKRVAPVIPFLLFALLTAVWSGWIRVGWNLPHSSVASQHGTLMVNSFLASLIFLERAVTLRRWWPLVLPAVNVVSAVFFAIGQPVMALWLLVVGSTGFALLCIYFVYRYEEVYYFIFLAGAFCLAGGNIVLLTTQFYPHAVTWWMGFFVFTIVAERVELSRFLPLSQPKRSLLLFCLGAVMVSLFWPFHLGGQFLFAGSMAATASWLIRYDMAKHSIKREGQHRYSGLLLISGYAWLVLAAFLVLIEDHLPFGYDAVLHSFFIGFVFSMIFSHAPIILPALTGVPVKIYHPVLYFWTGILYFTLMLRIVGDCTALLLLRKSGAIANGIVILLFFATVAFLFVRGRKRMKVKVGKKPINVGRRPGAVRSTQSMVDGLSGNDG